MIEETEITNFQSHKYSLFEFHPGVNVIKGTSHEGKSSVVRAFKWEFQNRPGGMAFASRWIQKKETTSIATKFSEGSFISRERSKSKNLYHIPEGTLSAVGTDVPEEVQRIAQMSETNIQSQHEGFFLLQDSPGIVAKKFNKIIGLQIIDQLVLKINGIVSEARIETKVAKKDITKTKTELQKLEVLDEIEGTITNIDKRFEKFFQIQDKLILAKKLYREALTHQQHITQCKKVLSLEEDVSKIEVDLYAFESLSNKLQLGIFLENNITFEKSQVEKYEKLLPLEKEIIGIEKATEKYQKIVGQARKCNKLYSDIEQANSVYSELQTKLGLLQKKEKLLHETLVICPLCEQRLPKALPVEGR